MSDEALQIGSFVKSPLFLTRSHFPFATNNAVNDNNKIGVNKAVTIEDTLSVALTVKKQTTPIPSLFPFDKFSSYNKHLRIASCTLRIFPNHIGCRNLDGSVTDPTKLDEA